MKTHLEIFERMKVLLKKEIEERVTVSKKGVVEKIKFRRKGKDAGRQETHVSIADSGVWLFCDDTTLVIGYGAYRMPCDSVESLREGLKVFFDLITKKKRISEYIRGKTCFKTKTEVKSNDDYYMVNKTVVSKSSYFAVWKTTVVSVSYEEKLIDAAKYAMEINGIKRLVQIHEPYKEVKNFY